MISVTREIHKTQDMTLYDFLFIHCNWLVVALTWVIVPAD